MSSKTFSNANARKLTTGYNSDRSSHLMGGKLSLNADRSSVSSSEYGTLSDTMGSAASRKSNYLAGEFRYQSPKHGYRAASSQVSPGKECEKIDKMPSRPLPSGPGPLMPPGWLSRSMKKQDTLFTQPKGPMKASHGLPLDGISNGADTGYIKSHLRHQSLSRAKSRSLSDVRSEGKEQYAKINSDRREINLAKARRGFSISRSPSVENIYNRRAVNNSEERAMMDKLSKTKIDESSRRSAKNKDFVSNYYSDFITPSKSTSNITKPPPGRPPKYQPDFSSEPTVPGHSVVHREDRPERVGSSSRPRYVIRQSSDSAYESNGSTGSSSGHSSPGMSKNQVKYI